MAQRTEEQLLMHRLRHKFHKTAAEYNLIEEGDRILIAVSGGKDSFLLAKCIEELQKHGKFPFEAYYVCMNPGYNKLNQEMIEKYSLYKFPAMVINDKVISKVELRGKGYNYIKEYIKGIICDG